VVRLAGILTQLACAACLLAGTIGFVLVEQNRTGGHGYAIAWAVCAIAGLTLGGLAARGGVVPLALGAVLCDGFAAVLLWIDGDSLASLLRVLPRSDSDAIGSVLVALAIALAVIATLDAAAIVPAVRELRRQRAFSTQSGTVPVQRPSMWQLAAVSRVEVRSRRRLYFVLGGFAIGCGAGIGVLVSSGSTPERVATAPPSPPAPPSSPAPRSQPIVTPIATPTAPPPVKPASAGSLLRRTGPASADALLRDQTHALERGDLAALARLLAPTAIGFGAGSDAIGADRDALLAQLRRDLGPYTAATIKRSHVGGSGEARWIAFDLELGARSFAVTELAVATDDGWAIAAWHWSIPIADAVAERRAILGTRPQPAVVTGPAPPRDIAAAVRGAFGSRAAFVAARSSRADGYNVGSAPGERIAGGRAIQDVFRGLDAEIRVHDGVRVVAVPGAAAALLNADFSTRTRAQTDLVITFRVLAVLVREDGATWRLAQTHWSHPAL
jgi:hypothetical protein